MSNFDYAGHNLDPEKFVTRRGISKLAEEVLGIPFPKSRIDKLSMRGEGPPVDAKIGQRELTRVKHVIPYLLSQLREVRS
jgi:hypothetical protein